MTQYHSDAVIAFKRVTPSVAASIRAQALALAPADLVDRLEAEGRLASDGYNNGLVKIRMPPGSAGGKVEQWVDLESGFADLQNPNGNEAQWYRAQREWQEAERASQYAARRDSHNQRQRELAAERQQELFRAWNSSDLSRALFTVAGEFPKSEPMLRALARAIAHETGPRNPTAPTDAALEFLGLEKHVKTPYEEG